MRATLGQVSPGTTFRPRHDPASHFISPKLIAYDLNGTAEGRYGIDTTTAAFNAMGARSIITTTVKASIAEEAMQKERAPFAGFHGGDEVRPSFGNKVYRSVGATYGLDVELMKHQMVIIGDSETDAPGDLSGVVFIHNDARTPAQALMLLIAELDARGHGSVLDGYRALAKSPSFGPLSFRTETRSPRGNTVPVIADVEVAYSVPLLAEALVSTASDPVGKANRELGRWWFEQIGTAAFADLIGALVKTNASGHGTREIERRTRRRRDQVATEKRAGATLLHDARSIVQPEFFERIEEPLCAGDPAILETLKAAGTAFLLHQEATRTERRRAVIAYAATAKTKVEDLVAIARGGDVMLPRHFLDALIPATRSDRERWLSALDGIIAATEDGTACGVRVGSESLQSFVAALDDAARDFDETEKALPERVAALLERGAAQVAAETQNWALINRAREVRS